MKFNCTFTGVDNSTDLEYLEFHSFLYPFVEWGVLLSFDRMGKDPRYPSLETFLKFKKIRDNAKTKMNSALHLCGRAAHAFISNSFTDDECELFNTVSSGFDRIQLNINMCDSRYDTTNYHNNISSLALTAKLIRQHLILQYNDNNKELFQDPDIQYIIKQGYVHVLKDSSGGKGIYNSDFEIPIWCMDAVLGFAGGYGPENIEHALEEIYLNVKDNKLSSQHFTIDMEGKIRTDDKLDLDKINQVSTIANNFLLRYDVKANIF